MADFSNIKDGNNLNVNTLITEMENIVEGAYKLNIGASSELTINASAITITSSNHTVDTESDAATDDLTTINGGVEGDVIFLQPESASRTVVVKDSVDNIKTAGDFSMDTGSDIIVLYYDGTSWIEVTRSNNA